MQKAALRLLPGKPEGAAVGCLCLVDAPEPAVQVRAYGVGRVIIHELSPVEQGIDERQPGGRPVTHGHGDGPVEFDDRRLACLQEHIVETHDL